MNINEEIIRLYHEYVADHPDGVKSNEVRDALRDQVRDLVASADRDVNAEVEALLSGVVGGERRARSRDLKKNLDYILDGFTEEGGYIDPYLELAYPLGEPDGFDKVLRHWTVADFQNLVTVRYRVAAESTAAASALDQTTQRIVDRMRASGGQTVGDVNWWLE